MRARQLAWALTIPVGKLAYKADRDTHRRPARRPARPADLQYLAPRAGAAAAGERGGELVRQPRALAALPGADGRDYPVHPARRRDDDRAESRHHPDVPGRDPVLRPPDGERDPRGAAGVARRRCRLGRQPVADHPVHPAHRGPSRHRRRAHAQHDRDDRVLGDRRSDRRRRARLPRRQRRLRAVRRHDHDQLHLPAHPRRPGHPVHRRPHRPVTPPLNIAERKSLMSTELHKDSQAPVEIALGRRRRWLIPAIVAALVVIAAAVTFAVKGSSSSTVAGSHFGVDLQVSYEADSSSELAFLQYLNQKIAPSYGLKITPVGIGDGNQLDLATANGQYAANIYQHQYWLKEVL